MQLLLTVPLSQVSQGGFFCSLSSLCSKDLRADTTTPGKSKPSFQQSRARAHTTSRSGGVWGVSGEGRKGEEIGRVTRLHEPIGGDMKSGSPPWAGPELGAPEETEPQPQPWSEAPRAALPEPGSLIAASSRSPERSHLTFRTQEPGSSRTHRARMPETRRIFPGSRIPSWLPRRFTSELPALNSARRGGAGRGQGRRG